MSRHTFKKASAVFIRQLVKEGASVSIEIDKDCWCDIVSSSLIYEDQPKIVFMMAGGNKPEKSFRDYEYKYKIN